MRKRLQLNELSVKDPAGDVEQAVHLRVVNAVVDDVADLSRGDEVLRPQDCELLRYTRSFDAKAQLQFTDALLAVAKQLQNTNARRMAEGFEEFRLEDLK